MTSRPTVYIVDDDEAVRSSIEFWLSSLGMDVRTFASGEDLLVGFAPESPCCIVVDLRMPNMDGLALQNRLHKEGTRVPIIFLTGHGSIPLAVQAMENGAVDFLEKPFEKEVLLKRIEQALDRDSAQEADGRELNVLRQRVDSLTRRQREVLDHVVQGKANKVIAIELGLSEKTIELHRAKMMKKMSAESLAELVRMWVTLERSNA